MDQPRNDRVHSLKCSAVGLGSAGVADRYGITATAGRSKGDRKGFARGQLGGPTESGVGRRRYRHGDSPQTPSELLGVVVHGLSTRLDRHRQRIEQRRYSRADAVRGCPRGRVAAVDGVGITATTGSPKPVRKNAVAQNNNLYATIDTCFDAWLLTFEARLTSAPQAFRVSGQLPATKMLSVAALFSGLVACVFRKKPTLL